MGNETLYKLKKSADSDSLQLEEVEEMNTIETEKVRMSVSNKILITSGLAVIIYKIISFILQFNLGLEPSPTLTEYWYRFWTCEIVVLSGIKISKVFKAHHGIIIDDKDEGASE